MNKKQAPLCTLHTLPEQHVSDGRVDVLGARLARVDHQAVDKLHRLGSLTTQLSADDHLAALSTTLHDESQHTVTRPGGGGYQYIGYELINMSGDIENQIMLTTVRMY